MSIAISCPEPRELEEFMLGKVSDATARRIEQHLAECGECSQTVGELKADDTLVAAMREQREMAPEPEEAIIDALIDRVSSLSMAESDISGTPTCGSVASEIPKAAFC